MTFTVYGVSEQLCVSKQLRRAEETGDFADDLGVGRGGYRDFVESIAKRYAYSARLSAPFERKDLADDFVALANRLGCKRVKVIER